MPLHYIPLTGSALTAELQAERTVLAGFEPATSPLVWDPGVEPGVSYSRSRRITVFLVPGNAVSDSGELSRSLRAVQ